jgi:hypothetical protein
MKRRLLAGIVLALAGLVALPCAQGQSDDDSTSLADAARTLRKEKPSNAPVVIDNDNLAQVMDASESHHLASLLFSLNGPRNSFQMSSPDGTCSLSFNANTMSLLSDPNEVEKLPASELTKLDGPATLDGDTLQISVFNGTDWDVKELIVGVTIVRPEESEAAFYKDTKLLPAAVTTEDDSENAGKASDKTILLHMKAQAAPLINTIFREKLSATIAPDQEWHWAILSAKGVPPPPGPIPQPTF